MEDLVGRKVKGFKFETDEEDVRYESHMDKHIGEVGVIKRYHKHGKNVKIQFKDDYWYYPVEEIEKHLVFEPKRGDKALFSDDGVSWLERFFVVEIEGVISPYFSVIQAHEEQFLNNEPFNIVEWKYMKLLPNKTKITKQQIACIFGIDLDKLEIVD